MTYALANVVALTLPLPDHIYFDRVYGHGSATQDFQAGIELNYSYGALIESYISDIHINGLDDNAVGAIASPGPLKIVDNHLEAAGENIIFGGWGSGFGGNIPSDIEIRNNYIYKPLAWVPLSLLPNSNPNSMVVKNAFECDSCQRVLFDSNVIENVWADGQLGYAIVLAVRTGQSGDFAVVNDITITNNVLKNVVSGINSAAVDDTCGPPPGAYPNCHNAGSQDRWNIANNLILFYDPTLLGGNRNLGLNIQPSIDRINNHLGMMKDVVFQHNTLVSAPSTPCWNSIFFGVGGQKPPFINLTSNIWLLDNALCRQPTGDWGLQGTAGLTQYMGMPSTPPYDLSQRFYGNVMYAPPGERVQTWPVHNYATPVPFTYVNPATGDFQLLTPNWTDTSDGSISGVHSSSLP